MKLTQLQKNDKKINVFFTITLKVHHYFDVKTLAHKHPIKVCRCLTSVKYCHNLLQKIYSYS